MPAIDDSPHSGLDLDALAEALNREGVVAAYLHGSEAKGTAGPLSDVDIGVFVDPALGSRERAELRLALIAAAGRAADRELDVTILNDASPLLRHRAIRDGRLILDRDPRQRVRLAASSLVAYLDTAPLRALLASGLRSRIASGTYGRP